MIARRRPGVPGRYLTGATATLALQLVGLSAAACSVYMIERTVGILENVLRFHFPLSAFLSLVVLQLPHLAEFSLPIALYAAAYFLLVDTRERREFVALAAAGASSNVVVLPVTIAAVAAFFLSLLFSDIVAPAATRAYRQIEATARASVLVRGIPDGSFFTSGDSVAFTPAGDEGGNGYIRLFQFRDAQLTRVLTSECARAEQRSEDILLRLCSGQAYLFAGRSQPMHVGIGETSYPVDRAVLSDARTIAGSGMSIRQLLATGEGGKSADSVRGIARVLSAFACLLAASLAIAAAAFTGPRGRTVTFAAGILALVGLLASRSSVAALLGGAALPALAAIGLIGFLAAVMLPRILAYALHRRLVAPALVKT
jgi:lipopolysaccharide export LptBFGC system permease protein LptF